MAPKQATLGKFFGGRDASKQQSTLSFKAKPNGRDKENEGVRAARDEDGDVAMSKGENEDGAEVNGAGSRAADKAEDEASDHGASTPKRKGDDAMDEDAEVEEPPQKRRRRAQIVEEEDDDGDAAAEPAAASSSDAEDGDAAASSESEQSEVEEGDEHDDAEPTKTAAAPTAKASKAAKAREKVQTTLVEEKDLSPDWPAGEPVPYGALCTTFSAIELTTKRLIIMAHCARFLRQVMRLTPDDLLPTVQLMVNKLAADYEGIELGIGESLIMKAIGEATGRSLAVVKADQRQIGDLGLVAAKSRGTQKLMFAPKALTVRGVTAALRAIATSEGQGSQQRKVDAIKKLLSTSDVGKRIDISSDKGGASEAKFIIRFLEGKLRLGLAERTVLVSLAHAVVAHEVQQQHKRPPSADELAEGEAILKGVYSELPNYEVVIPAILEHSMANLRDNCKLQPGIPLKPMLAKPTKSITEVLDRFENQTFTCEFKYDGERAQIHYVAADSPYQSAATSTLHGAPGKKGLAAVFSRNSEDLSKKYPDILARLEAWVKPETKSFVLDCETVAWDVEEQRVKPFQQLMTRKRKDVKADDVKVKVCVFAFDLLFLNGEAVVHKTLRQRRELLQGAFTEAEGEFRFAQGGDATDVEAIQGLLDDSMKAGCEGLMVKMLDAAESGYEPSKRSRNWLKVKKDYLAGVGDSLDLVVLGAYHGRGKRTSVYGAFLLACWNADTEAYESVCNIGTGFSEELLAELHASLSALAIDRPKPFYNHSAVPKDQPDVWLEPRQVWEVRTADLTLSPRYKAGAAELSGAAAAKGISLRFPRFVRIRDDKKPDQATSSAQIIEMYHKQESVAKSKGPAADDDFEY